MARFIDVHSGMSGVTREQVEEAHRKDLANEGRESVHFIKAWADPANGKIFCLSEGPSREAVMHVHERSGHPTSEVYEVPIEVS
jgi:hypothetical protein